MAGQRGLFLRCMPRILHSCLCLLSHRVQNSLGHTRTFIIRYAPCVAHLRTCRPFHPASDTLNLQVSSQSNWKHQVKASTAQAMGIRPSNAASSSSTSHNGSESKKGGPVSIEQLLSKQKDAKESAAKVRRAFVSTWDLVIGAYTLNPTAQVPQQGRPSSSGG